MELAELQVFLAVASERSFSRAAAKLHRTQPAVSQAVRRLEDELGEHLFDRSSKEGKLTDAGRVVQEYALRLMRLAEETESAVRELRDLRRGRVLIGANEAGVHSLLPLIARFPAAPSRCTSGGCGPARFRRGPVRSLDFGLMTFRPAEPLASLTMGADEMVLLPPQAPACGPQAGHDGGIRAADGDCAQRPSPARERVLRMFEERHWPLDIQIALPSLDGIKRAVEMQMGVALLPRRCALAEIGAGRLVAVRVAQVRRRGSSGSCTAWAELSHAAQAFLARAGVRGPGGVTPRRRQPVGNRPRDRDARVAARRHRRGASSAACAVMRR